MIKLNTIKDALDNVNIFDIPYDIGVFKTERLVQQAISPILDRWPLVYQTLEHQVGPPVTVSDFLKLKENFRSTVVIVMYSGVHGDYTLRLDILHNLLTWLKYKCNLEMWYDDYAVWKKTAAVYGGLGKIGENRLFWSRKFGFKCKIETIITDDEFEEYHDFKGDHRLALCKKCDEKHCMNAPKGCPILKEKDQSRFFHRCMNENQRYLKEDVKQEIVYWEKEDNYVYGGCSFCQEGCPYSETLVEKHIPKEIRDRRYRHELIEWPFLPPALEPYSFKVKLDEKRRQTANRKMEKRKGF